MKYRNGYKYQLAEDEYFKTDIIPLLEIKAQFIELNLEGLLLVKSGYAWDGPSGPTYDRKENMRGSLGHDALYQLIRNGLLDKKWRKRADEYMCIWCIEDGMWKPWAKLYCRELGKFGGFAADPKNVKKIYEVP